MFQDEQYELKNLDILCIQRLTINNQYKLLIGTIANTVSCLVIVLLELRIVLFDRNIILDYKVVLCY